ncbi:O-antigen ligase family protein [Sedimentibacter hydroxybenzoicus DSM 7310]|uniref:O-antigen ligase family protein n=1 Tax=Sedimentibacter hydroxybenzoicus DSM 7310 TaxID=1123245 RepID=A0A974GVF8_SEDHY|nr:O-antigen ligase family protein [Sedimentibacter hydroxybenzoicus]NYB73296.1 O-antigen ligase family protein [Sedimentibacter hydroxybenzoicus DSM 7310]
MNYEITGKQITELSNDKTNKVTILLLILSIVFIPAAYVFLAALLIKQQLKKSPITNYNKSFTLLYAYIAIGLISSEYKIISLFFGVLMILCIHSFNIFSTSLTKDDLTKIKKYVFIVSLIVFFYGILQYISPDFILPDKWVDAAEYKLNKRIYSTFFNPNVFGFYINFIILLVCEDLDTRKLNLESCVFLIAVFCLILTFSRAAWISLITTLIIAGFMNKNYFKYALITAVLIFSVDFILESGRIDPSKAVRDSSIIYRLEVWKASIAIIRDNFLSGIGFGTLFKHVGNYSGMVSSKIEHSHNLYLQVFTETGVLGFGIFTYLIINAFTYFRIKLKENKSQFITPSAIMIMSLIHGFADSVVLTPQIMMILCIYGGIVKASISKKALHPFV